MWIRTCQECGRKNPSLRPTPGKPLSTAFTERKCIRCHSSSLDYGYDDDNANTEE